MRGGFPPCCFLVLACLCCRDVSGDVCALILLVPVNSRKERSEIISGCIKDKKSKAWKGQVLGSCKALSLCFLIWLQSLLSEQCSILLAVEKQQVKLGIKKKWRVSVTHIFIYFSICKGYWNELRIWWYISSGHTFPIFFYHLIFSPPQILYICRVGELLRDLCYVWGKR